MSDATNSFRQRGFLPVPDPARAFAPGSRYACLDVIGNELPERLQHSGFRDWAEALAIPAWSEPPSVKALPALRLYYVRLGFLASAYVNQIGQPAVHHLPANIAKPLVHACTLLGRPPILSYDGYALYNWYRKDPNKPIALGNIDTLQNFVSLFDEHWFILVHVEIEALAGGIVTAILDYEGGQLGVDEAVSRITTIVTQQTDVLRRIPEHMSPDLYFATFRPYIRFFDHVWYQTEPPREVNFRGETGAQSSVVPLLDAFFKIPHEANALTRHLADMRRYMPSEHSAFLDHVMAMPAIRDATDPALFNGALEAIAAFRRTHFQWAKAYIDDRVADSLGTGGTPYMSWLTALIDETLAFRR